jgi:hypothetical protein
MKRSAPFKVITEVPFREVMLTTSTPGGQPEE